MYKIVLADDEEIIRSGLTDLVDWASMGFLLQSSFKDGQEVLDYVKEHDVDVILTDIEMVKLSGLEVARCIHESYPAIKVVLLSGYQQFEYAKLAIKYNVKEYLLKPLRYREIVQVFSEVKEELDREKAEREERMTNKRHSLELAQWCQQQLYQTIMINPVEDAEKLRDKLHVAHVAADPDNSPCLLLKLQTNSWNTADSNGFPGERLHEWLKLHMGQVYYVFRHDQEQAPDRHVLAIGETGLSLETLHYQVEEQLRQLKIRVDHLFGVKVQYRIVQVHQRLTDLLNNNLRVAFSEESSVMKANTILSTSSLIEKALVYMNEHCGEDISLESVAAYVHLNPIYFSRVFKEHTKANFIVHLTQLRIQKGIQLLNTHQYKIYEVAEKVGYQDSKYFAKLFRNATGLTPSEFLRKQVLRRENERQ